MMRSLLSCCLVLCVLSFSSASLQGPSWTNGPVVDRFGQITRHSNLRCWLNDSPLLSVPSNTFVTTWTDQSESVSPCAFTGTAPALPYVKKNIVNKHDVLRFSKTASSSLSNTNTAFERSLLATDDLTNNVQPFTAFVVARPRDLATASVPFSVSGTAGTPELEIKLTSTSDSSQFSAAFGYYLTAADVAATTATPSLSRFHIFALRQDASKTSHFVDGTTRTEAQTTLTTPVTKLTVGAVGQIRIGTDRTGLDFDGDIAEVLIYDTALTNNEIDRIGNSLASKFDLSWTWSPSSATQQGRGLTVPITIFPSEGPTNGGTITITGDRLVPYDTNADGKGKVGDALTRRDVELLQANVMVTLQMVMPPCPGGVPSSTQACSAQGGLSTRAEKECTNLQLWTVGTAAQDGATSGTPGTIQCELPPGIASELGASIKISWGGIPFHAPGFKYKRPTVDDVRPSELSHKGGETVTLIGSNFASGNTWFGQSDLLTTIVEIATDSSVRVACTSTKYVSPSEMHCVTPQLIPHKYAGITRKSANNKVQGSVIVRVGNFRTIGRAKVTYTNVPAYYSCYSTVKSECLACCPENCVSDVFVRSAYETCIADCSAFCSFTPSSDCNSLPAPPECVAKGILPGIPPPAPAVEATSNTTGVSVTVAATASVAATVRVGSISAFTPVTATAGTALNITFTGYDLKSTDIVKVIDGAYGNCGGQDPYFGAVEGGHGRNLVGSGLTATAEFTFTAGVATGVVCLLATGAEAFVRVGAPNSIFIKDGNPIIRSVSPAQHVLSGSVSVTLLGLEFGPDDRSGRIRLGHSTCQATRWVSDAAVVCRVASGTGIGLDVVITVGGRYDTRAGAARYRAPAVSSFLVSNAHATGAASVTVLGALCTSRDRTVSMTIGKGTAAAATRWVSDSCALCKMPAGQPGDVIFNVEVGTRAGVSRAWVSYNAPTPTSGNTNAPVTGNTLLTLVGGNFHKASLTARARVGGSSTWSTTWVSDTSVYGRTGPGREEALSAVVSIQTKVGSRLAAFTFDNDGGRAVSLKTNNNSPGTGCVSVTVLGSGFDNARSTKGARVGRTSFETTLWQSSSSMTCKLVSLARLNDLNVAVSVLTLVKGTLTQMFSYRAFTTASTTQSNSATTGGTSVTILGASLGERDASARARIGGTATVATRWVSETSVSSKQAPGAPLYTGSSVVASVRGRTAALSAQQSFDKYVLTGVGLGNGAGSGANSITLVGSSFGPSGQSAKGRVHGTASGATSWKSDSAIMTRAPMINEKTHGGRTVVASMGLGNVATKVSAYTFDGPAVVGPHIMQQPPSSGAISLTLIGKNLGPTNMQSVTTRVGGTAAEATGWVSSSSLRAKVASGSNIAQSLAVTADSVVGTQLASFSFASTTATMVSPGAAGATGAASVTVLGVNYGHKSVSTRARIDGTRAEAIVWVSDSTLVCKLNGAQTHNGKSLAITLLTQRTTRTLAFTFTAPSTSSSLQLNHPATGATSVTVLGASLGVNSITRRLSFGSSVASATWWISDTALTAKTPRGTSPTQSVTVSIVPGVAVTQATSGGGILSHNTPVASAALKANAPQSGAVSVTLLGTSYGSADPSLRVRVGRTGPEASNWISSSSLTTRWVGGGRSDSTQRVAMTQARQVRSLAAVFTHDNVNLDTPPLIVCTGFNCGPLNKGTNSAVTGAASVTIVAAHLSTHRTQSLRFGGTACEITRWLSVTGMQCRIAAGAGRHLAIVATVDQQFRNTLTSAFTFPTARVTGISDACAPATGASSVTVLGSNLGQQAYSSPARMGGTGVESTRWVSQSSTRGKVPTGTGDLSINVVATLMVSSAPLEHAYGTQSQVFQYVPALSSSVVTNLPATGSTSVTVLGASMSHHRTTIRVRIGSSASTASTWVSDSSVSAKPQGHGTDVRTTAITSVRRVYSLSHASYNNPAPSGVLMSNAPSTGSASVTILGASMSQGDRTNRARLGTTASAGTKWVSDSCLVAKHSSRRYGSFNVAVTSTRSRFRTLAAAFTSNRPELKSLANNHPATSASMVTLLGANYPGQLTSRARVGGTGCQSSTWTSSTSVRCKMPGGSFALPGGTHGFPNIAITMISVASLTNAHTYDGGIITGTSRTNGPTSGGSIIYVTGRNFADSGVATPTSYKTVYFRPSIITSDTSNMYNKACSQTKWIADTSLECTTPVGYPHGGSGIDHSHALWVQDQQPQILNEGTQFTKGFSYDKPVISSVKASNTPTTGAVSVTVLGMNYGSVGMTVPVRVRFSRNGQNFDNVAGGQLWVSVSSMALKVPAGGSDNIQLLTDHVADGVSGSHTQILSYDTPRPSSVHRSNSPQTGASSVTVLGSSFATSMTVRVSIGATSAMGTTWVSDTTLYARSVSAQAGNRGRVVASVSRPRQTLAAVFSFDGPVARLLVRTNGPATGSISLTLLGASTGRHEYTTRARLVRGAFNQAAHATMWTADSTVVVKSPSGTRKLVGMSVTAGVVSDLMTRVFTFQGPILSAMHQVNRPATGACSVTMFAANLGSAVSSATSRVAGTACEVSTWGSDTTLLCKLIPAPTAPGLVIVATVDSLVGSVTSAFSFDVAKRTASTATNVPTTGSTSVTVLGSTMGVRAATQRMRMGRSVCSATLWTSDTSVRGRMPMGALDTGVIVTAFRRPGTTGSSVSYNVPVLTPAGTNPWGAALTGASSVTLLGSSFGTVNNSPRLRFGQPSSGPLVNAEVTQYLSDTSMYCKTPASSASGPASGVVTVKRNKGTTAAVYQYHSPKPTSIGAHNVPATGAASVTIFGDHMGYGSESSRSRQGSTAMEATMWISTSAVRGRSVKGDGGLHMVQTTIARVVGTGSNAWFAWPVSFHKPIPTALAAVTQNNGPSTGSISVTVLGASYGLRSASATSKIGVTVSPGTTWKSDTSLYARVPRGKTADASGLSITVQKIVGSKGTTFSYASPVATSFVGSQNGDITVRGTNFGMQTTSSLAATTTQAATALSAQSIAWTSDTSVLTKFHATHQTGTGTTFQLTINGAVHSSTYN